MHKILLSMLVLFVSVTASASSYYWNTGSDCGSSYYWNTGSDSSVVMVDQEASILFVCQ